MAHGFVVCNSGDGSTLIYIQAQKGVDSAIIVSGDLLGGFKITSGRHEIIEDSITYNGGAYAILRRVEVPPQTLETLTSPAPIKDEAQKQAVRWLESILQEQPRSSQKVL